jgi:20S proteasome subunit beta 7
MMIADTLGSYGSLARFKDMRRLHAVSENTLIGVRYVVQRYVTPFCCV